MKPLSKNAIAFVLAILVIGALFSTYQVKNTKPEEIGFATLVERVEAGAVTSVEVSGSKITAIAADGSKAITEKAPDEALETLLATYGVSPEQIKAANIRVKDGSLKAYIFGVVLPSLVPLLILGGVFYFLIRQMQGSNNRAMSFGQSGAREADRGKSRLTFVDVAGAREAKEELEEVVDFLKNPEKFADMGAKIPRGVLLMGRPGTGKTLLARAVAGEADVPFFFISGSEFVEMFVGVGASRVRDLFARAKRSAPCIIFVDEIDAVGRQRGAGLGGSHDEREQTLNQILVEMDGFDPTLGVIVVAATNRPDVLDPALLRPGRFDRRVMIDLPDIKEREAILSVHAKGKPLASDVNLRRVAERTPGFSGADLMNLLNEAAIRATRQNRKEITLEDALTSIEKVLLGPERKSHVMSPEKKRVTAYHEAGHALVANTLPDADPVHKVSIISRGYAAGYTLKLPDEDKRMHRKKEFLADMAVMLGGYVAELETFGDLTTGASDDLKKCTRLARDLVTRYGMSGLGPRVFGEQEEMVFLGRDFHEQRNYSEETARRIDVEVERLIDGALETARGIILGDKAHLNLIAEKLLKEETIERDAFDALFTETTA